MITIVDNCEVFYEKLFDLQKKFMPIIDQMSRANFFDEFRQNTRIYFVALDDSQKPIGYIGLFDADSDLNIISIVVDKSFQNKGVGGMLIDKAVKCAISLSKKSLSLEVDEENIIAINFYLKHSFKEVSRRKNYYHNNDAIVMFRYL